MNSCPPVAETDALIQSTLQPGKNPRRLTGETLMRTVLKDKELTLAAGFNSELRPKPAPPVATVEAGLD